jgi:Zn-dependent M28 family amino/carboxypeptidase
MAMSRLRRFSWAGAVLAPLTAGLTACITQPGVRPIATPPVAVDETALRTHVAMLSHSFHPRSYLHPANLDRAADYIAERFRAVGARTDEQRYVVEGRTFRNLIARFGPDDGPLLVIGAHYDSWDDTPGADDNASGVAGLLEIARLLAARPPPRAVELVAYTLEEPPFFRSDHMGSMRHARALREQGHEVRLMLSLEMIGYFDDAPGSQRYPMSGLGLLYPEAGDFIALVGPYRDFGLMRRVKALFKGASTVPTVSINAPAFVQGVDFSDHASYWRHGFPAIMVTDTAFLRNPNYHGPGDTADTLDYARMAQVVRAACAVAVGL